MIPAIASFHLTMMMPCMSHEVVLRKDSYRPFAGPAYFASINLQVEHCVALAMTRCHSLVHNHVPVTDAAMSWHFQDTCYPAENSARSPCVCMSLCLMVGWHYAAGTGHHRTGGSKLSWQPMPMLPPQVKKRTYQVTPVAPTAQSCTSQMW